ncbi:MAG: prolyl oligopeptidase family serine peptidase [Gemmatimonadales bacterium]|jgi:dipeptidyl aminopeptidase/acylaminoacyl peptidase
MNCIGDTSPCVSSVPTLAGLRRLAVATFGLVLLSGPLAAQQKRPLTYTDLMKFRQVESPSVSKDGRWIAFQAAPDRGDGEVIVRSTDGTVRYTVPLGAAPVLAGDSRWVAMRLEPSLEAAEKAKDAKAEDKPRTGLALLSTANGEVQTWEEVQRFSFSSDGRWLARLHFEVKGEEETDEEAAGQEQEKDKEREREDPGTLLVLRNLETGSEIEVEHVRSFAFDERGEYLAYGVAAPDGAGDGLYLLDLSESSSTVMALDTASFAYIETLAWWEEGTGLAWVAAIENEAGEPGPGSLFVWDGEDVRTAVAMDGVPEGWMLPAKNTLRWTEDGERLFFGYRPASLETEPAIPEVATAEGDQPVAAPESAGPQEEEVFDPYDLDAILADRGVDVWHTDDPLINPNQKRQWNREQERTYEAVYHVRRRRAVHLADTLVQLRGYSENPKSVLATSSVPYRKQRTWIGTLSDLYVVSLTDGERTLVAERLEGGGSAVGQWVRPTGAAEPDYSLSPEGRYVVYFQDRNWHLFDAEKNTKRNLTASLRVSFSDEDHDYRNAPSGYGVVGWIEGDRGVLIQDKYDVWQFPTGGGEPVNLTGGQGRVARRALRVLQVDPEIEAYAADGWVHLVSFNEVRKNFGFYRTRAGSGGLERLLEEEKRFRFLAKAEDADVLLYTREDYDEFPDLWVADLYFGNPRKLTDVNPQLSEFAWGTSELVEWTSDDGVRLQGVVIKPGNYEPGQRYPVLTYFYRFFSQRLHEFNEPVINHRPSFPIYASDGYIVFLPDVRFEVGRPGMAALKSVVPGVKKLVDMGLADPSALGLHGHSWSGYTTAFIVTQTNIFAAAVAGAPVANMTSAYGGIRWGSGLARQFQYEMGQSRLSGSLWEARSDYIENSPLFYADRVETPLVIMHGDEDEAVPWYQSIEFYLALRRLGKHAVFLQYRGEPHHPRKYSNKLDYSIRMKEFFDHHLKGEPAPKWWVEGVPYGGN